MSEKILTGQVAQYIQLVYPEVYYHIDFGSGCKLTMGQAVQNKKLNKRAYPDLTILEARKGFHGLCLELKKDGTKIYLKDELTLVADKHIREQAEVLQGLRDRGYSANFGIGFDECKMIIDSYLK